MLNINNTLQFSFSIKSTVQWVFWVYRFSMTNLLYCDKSYPNYLEIKRTGVLTGSSMCLAGVPRSSSYSLNTYLLSLCCCLLVFSLLVTYALQKHCHHSITAVTYPAQNLRHIFGPLSAWTLVNLGSMSTTEFGSDCSLTDAW